MSTTYEEAVAHPEKVEREVEDGLKSCRRIIRDFRKRLVAAAHGERQKS